VTNAPGGGIGLDGRRSMNFGIKTDSLDDGVVAIALSGEVDLYTAPRLKEELVGAIEGGATNVVVDMTDTVFIDSTTLGVLVGGLRRLRPGGGELALVVTDRNIRKIFEITGLDRVFSLHETREDAVGAVTTSA
jgi:anti-sigma B factor antagonist